jgi:hypothetical protein
MKTTRYLFTIIAFGALALGRSYAVEPAGKPSGQDLRQHHAADRMNDSGAQAERKVFQLHNNGRAPARTSQAGPVHIQSMHTSANGLHQPGLKKTASAANYKSMMNKTGSEHQQLARLSIGGGTTALSPGVVRGRSASAADTGGLSPSSVKHSTAALDGAAVGRRPR